MIYIDTENTSNDSESLGTITPEVDSQSTVSEPTEVDNSQPVAQGQSEDEQSFFDPKTVPEELVPAYKQMQSAFTKKTQEIATRNKEYEALQQQVESFKRYEQHIPILEEMLSAKQNAAVAQTPELLALEQELRQAGFGENEIEYMKVVGGGLLNIINRQKTVETENTRISTGIESAGKLDPRLQDQSLTYSTEDGQKFTFGQMVEELVAATPNWSADPVKATQAAIRKVDSLMGAAKLQGKEELSASAGAKARQFPSTSSSPQSSGPAGGKMSFQEAAEAALKEVGV